MIKVLTIGLALCIAMSIITTASATEKQNNNFLSLGSGISHSYKNIPFEIGDVLASVSFPATAYYELRLSDTINLSGYTATAIHIIEHAAYADNVPDGVVVGHIKVYYQDGDDTSLDLVMGQNIAEWAYDRPEVQHCLQHTKIPPAYSSEATTDSGYRYLGHYFCVSITTQEKPLSHLELTLDSSSYTNQKYYGYSSADWFVIAIKAVTISLSQPQLPDLTPPPDDITFSNPNPTVGETVTITATIHNIGNADANDVIVQFFDGNPDNGGAQIGDDQVIDLITAGGSEIAQIDWTVSSIINVYVVVDPYNGIKEFNDSNNVAFKLVSGALSSEANLDMSLWKQTYPIPITKSIYYF